MKDMPVPLALLLLGLALFLVMKLVSLLLQTSAFQQLARRLAGAGEGDYVAEVALSWFFGRGSVLYRQRFRTEAAAVAAAKRQAVLLDRWLPKYYYDTDSSGNRIQLEHEYGIGWSTRRVTEAEADTFHALDRRALPGY